MKKSQRERQAEEIAAIEAAIAAENEAKAADPSPKKEEPAEPKQEESQKPETSDTPAEPQKEAASQETPPKMPEPNPWEQRYRSLEGKYRAEVPRLHEQLRSLQETVQELEAQRQREPDPKTTEPLVTEEDIAEYGPEMISLIKRQATEIANSAISSMQDKLNSLAQENQQLRDKLTGVVEQQSSSKQQQTISVLAQHVPNWEQVNSDPNFLNWLGQIEPMAGVSRQQLLDDAFNQNDGMRLAQIFNAFLGTRPAPQQKSQDVSRQAEPNKSKSAAPPAANPNERIWTEREISQFYSDRAKGKLSMSRDEMAKLENQIDLAVATGRVRMS